MLWGIDLGGTKIEAVVLEKDWPLKIIDRERVPTEQQEGYDHIINQIKKLVDQVAEKIGSYPSEIGMGTPGSIDPLTSTLKNSNTQVLNGKPFKKDVEDKLGIPVHIANDANCFALAEALFGVVREEVEDAKVVFGVIMGTGVGGGVVVNGKVIDGAHGIGGEWGHNVLDPNGLDCYCGKKGCVETIISGPFLERYYEGLTGQKTNLKDIVLNAKKGTDTAAEKTMRRLVEEFAKGIAVIINILDPDAIVIGGGLGNIELLYNEGVEEVKKHVFNTYCNTRFLKPSLGDSAGVIGAALLCS